MGPRCSPSTPLPMRFLPLVNVLFYAIVDDDIYDLASRYRWWWRAQSNGRRGYCLSYGTHPPIRLHHLVLRPSPGQVVDHINGDTRDNRRANLRLATHSESNANRRMPLGRSRYRGVWPERDRFRATIRVRGVRHHLGVYGDEVAAARAYDEAAWSWFGPFAVLNFPGAHGGGSTSAPPAVPPRRRCRPRGRRRPRG